jgi:hypothetical protein
MAKQVRGPGTDSYKRTEWPWAKLTSLNQPFSISHYQQVKINPLLDDRQLKTAKKDDWVFSNPYRRWRISDSGSAHECQTPGHRMTPITNTAVRLWAVGAESLPVAKHRRMGYHPQWPLGCTSFRLHWLNTVFRKVMYHRKTVRRVMDTQLACFELVYVIRVFS